MSGKLSKYVLNYELYTILKNRRRKLGIEFGVKFNKTVTSKILLRRKYYFQDRIVF